MPTISIVKGKGYARHNDRSLDRVHERSWDPSLSQKNVIYKNEDIKDAYHKLFDDALAAYNEKQKLKHPERVIDNYFDHISRSKQEKLCYELIVQVGNKDDWNPEYELVLDEYCKNFQKRNPNFYVTQMIEHNDEEAVSHTHIMFIPFSDGNKRGLERKNSLSGALQQMGYGRNGFKEWRENELNTFKTLLEEHHLAFQLGDGRQEHLSTKAYKEEVVSAKEDLKTVSRKIEESKLNLYILEASTMSKEKEWKKVNSNLNESQYNLSQINDQIDLKRIELDTKPSKSVDHKVVELKTDGFFSKKQRFVQLPEAEFDKIYKDYQQRDVLNRTINEQKAKLDQQMNAFFDQVKGQRTEKQWEKRESNLVDYANQLEYQLSASQEQAKMLEEQNKNLRSRVKKLENTISDLWQNIKSTLKGINKALRERFNTSVDVLPVQDQNQALEGLKTSIPNDVDLGEGPNELWFRNGSMHGWGFYDTEYDFPFSSFYGTKSSYSYLQNEYPNCTIHDPHHRLQRSYDIGGFSL